MDGFQRKTTISEERKKEKKTHKNEFMYRERERECVCICVDFPRCMKPSWLQSHIILLKTVESRKRFEVLHVNNA